MKTIPILSRPCPLPASKEPKTGSDLLDVIIDWSKDGWEDIAQNSGYMPPVGDAMLSGTDAVEKLTNLLHQYFLSIEEVLSEYEDEEADLRIRLVTDECLNIAEEFSVKTLKDLKDHHQTIHFQEICSNFLRTIIVFYDAIFGAPQQLSSTTRPESIELQLHPSLCGLLYCEHILEPTSTHQGPRIPYTPHRVGKEITYEEIANVYRTSRVNIRRLVQDKLWPKLRPRLRDFRKFED